MYYLLIYIFYVILAIYAIALVWAKWHSPFWFHQPVFHSYELHLRLLWSKHPYWKRKRTVKVGIFCDTRQVETWSIQEFNHWTPLCLLLQGHYIDNQAALFYCTPKYLQTVLHGNSAISCFRENVLTQQQEDQAYFLEKPNYEHFYGCIASRPVCIFFLHYPEMKPIIHFWDFLCVHPLYSIGEKVSRSLIQTHIYNHCIQNPELSGGYCFIKHGALSNGIVPLTHFHTYTFVLKPVHFHKLPRNYRIYCLNANHIDLWKSIYMQMALQYEVCILPAFEYTVDWLTNERYTIYATVYRIMKTEHVHGIYIFEKTRKSWENDSLTHPSVIRLVASMEFTDNHKHDANGVLFFRGFVNCLQEYLLLEGKDCSKGVLEIPCLSDNEKLLEKWSEKYELLEPIESGLYLYNLVYPSSPIGSNRVLLLP